MYINETTYIRLSQAAYKLGLPPSYLKKQVEEKTISHIKSGRTIYVSLDVIKPELETLAKNQIENGA